jgi:mRNA interferase HigB
MRVIGLPILESFWQNQHQARKPFEKWIQVVKQANWSNWSQLKLTFRSADLVPVRTKKFVVFNVGGNKYRIVTIVNFKGQIVIVEAALTHKQYDKGRWKD